MGASLAEHLIKPQWGAPPNVKAVVTTRHGGFSPDPFADLNLALHVGDDPERVFANRARLARCIGTELKIAWLNQVHGTDVFEITNAEAKDGGVYNAPTADAAITSQPGNVCTVMTADCLPVLFAARDGSQVAAAHAGWRGLCAGILAQTVNLFRSPAEDLLAWFGPAIGPRHFQVGGEVREAYLRVSEEYASAFTGVEGDKQYWMADIYLLARQQLKRCGLQHVFGGDFCTFSQSALFYSYRRDGTTGRMASMIWIESA